jgi:hypothetical protein
MTLKTMTMKTMTITNALRGAFAAMMIVGAITQFQLIDIHPIHNRKRNTLRFRLVRMCSVRRR